MGRKRLQKYSRGRIWTFLKRNPGSTRNAIANALGLLPGSCSNALVRMRELGKAKREGNTHKAVWYAVGDTKPISQSGLHVNSAANLHKTRAERQRLLRLANIAKGMDPDKMKSKRVRRAHTYYTGALEKCWPLSQAKNPL